MLLIHVSILWYHGTNIDKIDVEGKKMEDQLITDNLYFGIIGALT